MRGALGIVTFASCLALASCSGQTAPGDPGTGGTGVGSTTSGGGGVDPTPASCEEVCARIARWACTQTPVKMCASQCNDVRLKVPTCSGASDEYLRCLATAPVICNPGQSEPSFPDCNAQRSRYAACINPTPLPPVFAAGSAGCPSMPTMPGLMCTVVGPGSSSSATSGGEPPVQQCSSVCVDQSSNAWSSNCVGSYCVCRHNEQEYCRCTTAGAACVQGTCCPIQ